MRNCGCKRRPQRIHHNVQEILDMIVFTCPGCGANKKYKQFFAHVAECDKITEEMKTSQNQMKQKVAAN